MNKSNSENNTTDEEVLKKLFTSDTNVNDNITDEEILKLDFFDFVGSSAVFMSDEGKINWYRNINPIINNKQTTMNKSIDNVTVDNLSFALQGVGIELDIETIDNIIDLVELIERKGNCTTIDDVLELKKQWDY